MKKNTSVTLGDHFAGFIEDQVKRGRFDSASEVVRAGLRLLEEHETRVEMLRAALIEGEQSGPAEPFDFDAFTERKHGERAVRETSGRKPTTRKRATLKSA